MATRVAGQGAQRCLQPCLRDGWGQSTIAKFFIKSGPPQRPTTLLQLPGEFKIKAQILTGPPRARQGLPLSPLSHATHTGLFSSRDVQPPHPPLGPSYILSLLPRVFSPHPLPGQLVSSLGLNATSPEAPSPGSQPPFKLGFLLYHFAPLLFSFRETYQTMQLMIRWTCLTLNCKLLEKRAVSVLSHERMNGLQGAAMPHPLALLWEAPFVASQWPAWFWQKLRLTPPFHSSALTFSASHLILPKHFLHSSL